MTTTYESETTQMMFRARKFVAQHAPGWSVEWDRAKNRWGAAHFGTKTISFSAILFSLNNTMEEFEKTLIHETAHAIAGHEAGHGPVWKAAVRSLGGNPQRCRPAAITPEKNYTGKCKCGATYGRDRKSAAMFRGCCTKCHAAGKGYVLLTWYDNKTNREITVAESPAPRRSPRRRPSYEWSF